MITCTTKVSFRLTTESAGSILTLVPGAVAPTSGILTWVTIRASRQMMTGCLFLDIAVLRYLMRFLAILLTPELLKEGEDAAPDPQQVFLQRGQQLRSPDMLLQHCDMPILPIHGNQTRSSVRNLHVLQAKIACSLGLGREGDGGQHARPIGARWLSKAGSAEGNCPCLVADVRTNSGNIASRACQEGAQLCCRHMHDGWREGQGELEAPQVDHIGNSHINCEGFCAEVGCLLRRVNPDNSGWRWCDGWRTGCRGRWCASRRDGWRISCRGRWCASRRVGWRWCASRRVGWRRRDGWRAGWRRRARWRGCCDADLVHVNEAVAHDLDAEGVGSLWDDVFSHHLPVQRGGVVVDRVH